MHSDPAEIKKSVRSYITVFVMLMVFTILTVTAANPNIFSGANTAIPAQIFANAASPYTGAQARAWGAALTLIVIAFILMIAARIITARFTRYSR